VRKEVAISRKGRKIGSEEGVFESPFASRLTQAQRQTQ
jgi:hypothetical protein